MVSFYREVCQPLLVAQREKGELPQGTRLVHGAQVTPSPRRAGSESPMVSFYRGLRTGQATKSWVWVSFYRGLRAQQAHG